MLPTRVGVNRALNPPPAPFANAPHARGGEPYSDFYIVWKHECSPRAWG